MFSLLSLKTWSQNVCICMWFNLKKIQLFCEVFGGLLENISEQRNLFGVLLENISKQRTLQRPRDTPDKSKLSLRRSWKQWLWYKTTIQTLSIFLLNTFKSVFKKQKVHCTAENLSGHAHTPKLTGPATPLQGLSAIRGFQRSPAYVGEYVDRTKKKSMQSTNVVFMQE